jgi:hypothetical protein
MRFAHVINPVSVDKNNSSYLYYTQPITFESMYQSKMLIENKNKNVYVDLYTINYEEDDEIIPDYFIKLPYLNKSTKTEYPKFSKKKLPFIQDIFDSINKYVNADYIIFTNSDIIVHNNFYQFIYKQIIKHNFDSMIINRRDNIPKFINNIQLNKEHLNLIFELSGEKHIGRDCFIIENSILKKINMKNMFIAHPPWGLILMKYLSKLGNNFKMLRSEFLTFHLGNDNNHQSSNKLDELTKINIINSKLINI